MKTNKTQKKKMEFKSKKIKIKIQKKYLKVGEVALFMTNKPIRKNISI